MIKHKNQTLTVLDPNGNPVLITLMFECNKTKATLKTETRVNATSMDMGMWYESPCHQQVSEFAIQANHFDILDTEEFTTDD